MGVEVGTYALGNCVCVLYVMDDGIRERERERGVLGLSCRVDLVSKVEVYIYEGGWDADSKMRMCSEGQSRGFS